MHDFFTDAITYLPLAGTDPAFHARLASLIRPQTVNVSPTGFRRVPEQEKRAGVAIASRGGSGLHL